MSLQSSQKQNPGKYRNIVFVLILLIGFTVYQMNRNSNPVTYQFTSDSVTLTGPDNAPAPITVSYDTILSVYELSELELGTNLSGLNTAACQFGTWENDLFGTYTLCAYSSVTEYMVIQTSDGTVVCNYESADATQHMYTAFLDLLNNNDETE